MGDDSLSERFFSPAQWLLVCGLLVRLLGVGLMIKSKGAHGTTAELVIVQVIQGMGGGIASASTQLLAQASVPHQDVATVTAFVLLFAEIGNAVGESILPATPMFLPSQKPAEADASLCRQCNRNCNLARLDASRTEQAPRRHPQLDRD